MAGLNGIDLPGYLLPPLNRLYGLGDQLAALGVGFPEVLIFLSRPAIVLLGALLGICWLLPNTQELVSESALNEWPRRRALLGWPLRWCPTVAWAIAVSGLWVASVSSLSRASEFLYFQF
jgi:hypothetical protein